MGRKSRNRRQDRGAKVALKPPGPREIREVITFNPAPALDLRPKTKWFLLFTAPKAEARVAEDLTAAGCDAFWPSRHKVVTVGARVRWEGDIPTFPRYLFASGPLLNGEEPETPTMVRGRPIGGVFDIEGVQSIVSDHLGWARVQNKDIRKVVNLQNGVALPIAPDKTEDMAPGAEALILSGPFMHFQATIVEQLGRDPKTQKKLVQVLVAAFGRSIPATFEAEALRPKEAA